MNEISKNPLVLEINQDLDLRIKAFSEKWRQYCIPDTFKKIVVTLRSSAILQITSKVNAALTAKKNGDNIDSFLKDLNHLLDPNFSPDIKGNAIEKGRFNDKISHDALELLKGFSVFVGNRAIAYFDTPSGFKATHEIRHDTPNGHDEVIDTQQNLSPEKLQKRLVEISIDIQKKGTETELSNYIKTVMQREKLAIDNAISRAKRTVSEEIFQAQCSHLTSFSVSLNDLILAAKNKLNHIKNSPVRAASMSRVDSLLNDEPTPDNSMETAGIKNGIEQRPSLPTLSDENRQRPKESEKILKDIQTIIESGNIGDLKNYRTRSLLKPLSSLMKQGKTKSEDNTSQQRKDFLAEQLFHVDAMIKRMEAKKMMPAHQHLDPAPKMIECDKTNTPSNDADIHLPREPSASAPTIRRRILALGATAAAAVATIASIGLGMLNFDTQAKAGNQTIQKPITASFNTVAFVEERVDPVNNIENINHFAASAPKLEPPPLTLKQKRIKYNFRKIVNNDDIKPAVVGEFQMKRVTANTLENLCKMYKNPTWVCLSNQSPT